jgi:ABC-type transport system involved in multi-copper enzyme maturation permease subunit
MLGPVCTLELTLGGRRGQAHVFRWLYAGWLVFLLLSFWCAYFIQTREMRSNTGLPITSSEAAKLLVTSSTNFINYLLHQHFVLLILATPIFAAGAIADEKQRGTLLYLITADLTPLEIVLGKLFARMWQVASFLLTALPPIVLFGVLAGLAPTQLVIVGLSSLGPIYAFAALAILFSVWCRQTRDAVIGVYCAVVSVAVGLEMLRSFGALSTVGWFGTLLGSLDPDYILAPALAGAALNELLGRLVLTLSAWGALGTGCLVWAILRLKPLYRKQLEGKTKMWFPKLVRRPPVGEHPLLWKERYIEGLVPYGILKYLPRWLALLSLFFGALILNGLAIIANLPILPNGQTDWTPVQRVLTTGKLSFLWTALNVDIFSFLVLQAVVILLLFSAVVGIRCSGCVTGEREKLAWEALLLAPIDTKPLLWGKLWGILGAALPYLLVYQTATLMMTILVGPSGLFICGLSILVTLLFMFFLGATGIWCSAWSKSSWRSLLMTNFVGYVGGFFIWLCASPVLLIIAGLLLVVFTAVDQALGLGVATWLGTAGIGMFMISFWVASWLGIGLLFFGMGFYFMNQAVNWVANRERIRIWGEPTAAPRRRRRIKVGAPVVVPPQQW